MYGKVFESIYEGTLHGHWQAIVTIQQFIVLSDADGVVDMTPQSISNRTSIPLAIIEAGIEHLEKPDPYSRTPGEEGRRIVRLYEHRPWGWRLVNHWKYRALRDMEQKREADRKRISEKRSKNSDVAIPSQSVANVAHAKAHTDADANAVASDKSRSQNQWWKTEQGIEAKGVELGVPPRRGETWPEYKSRLFDVLKAKAA